jgi:hypothetical protein
MRLQTLLTGSGSALLCIMMAAKIHTSILSHINNECIVKKHIYAKMVSSFGYNLIIILKEYAAVG